MANKAVNSVQPRIVSELIHSTSQQAEDEMRQHQRDQEEELAEDVCAKIADIIIGQSIKGLDPATNESFDPVKELPKPVVKQAPLAIPEEVSLANPLMDYMTQYAVGGAEKRIVQETIGKAIEEHILLEFAFESVLRSILRDPSPSTKTTPLISTIPMMSPQHNPQENKIFKNYHKMAPERRHGTVREPEQLQAISPLKALETNQSSSQIKQVQAHISVGQDSQLVTQSQSSKCRKSSQNIAEGKGSSVISITLNPTKKKSLNRQTGSMLSNSTTNVLGSHGSTVIIHEKSPPEAQAKVALIDLQPEQHSPERVNSKSPKYEEQTDAASSNMNGSLLEQATKRIMRTQDQPSRKEPNFVAINKKIVGARVSSRERSKLSNHSRYSRGGSVSPRSKSPISTYGKPSEGRPTLIKNYVNSQYTIVPVTAISTTTLAGTALPKSNQLSQTKSACSSRSTRDIKSPLNLNHRIGKGLKQASLIGQNTSFQRGQLQRGAYGSVPKLREADQDDRLEEKAFCTVSRLESNTTLIENAYDQNESDAGFTSTTGYRTLEKGQHIDRQDQGLIQKLLQSTKTKESQNARSRGTNVEKKSGIHANMALTKSQNHLLTTRGSQPGTTRDFTKTLAPSQSVLTMASQRQGNKITGSQVQARAPASVSKATHLRQQQELKSYSSNQGKKAQTGDNRPGNSSRHLFRRTLTPNLNIRQSGKVAEATFAAESESIQYASNQSQLIQKAKPSPLNTLVQNDLVACKVFDDMIRNQIRRIAGSYFQSLLIDHFYKRTLKKVVRMTLFQVIQESVDTIYFLEEDTISTANIILDNLLKSEIKVIASEVYYQQIGSTSAKYRSGLQREHSPGQAPLTNRVPESCDRKQKQKLQSDQRLQRSQRSLLEEHQRGYQIGQPSDRQMQADKELSSNLTQRQRLKQGSISQNLLRSDLEEELVMANEEMIDKNVSINKLSPGPALKAPQYQNDPGFSRRHAITLYPIQGNEPISSSRPQNKETPSQNFFTQSLKNRDPLADELRVKQQKTGIAKRKASPLLNISARRHKVNPFFPNNHFTPQKNQTQTKPLNIKEILRQGSDERPATSQCEHISPLRFSCTDQEDQMSYISNVSANLGTMKQGHNLTPRLTIESSPSKRILPQQYLAQSRDKDSRQKRSFVEPKKIVETEDQEVLCEVVSSGESEQKCEFDAGARNNAVKQSMNTNTLTVLETKKFQPNKRFTLSPQKNLSRLLMPSQTHGNLHLRNKY